MIRSFEKDRLSVNVFETRDEMGRRAAADITECMLALLGDRPEINVIFAAAPSQNEMLHYLRADARIPWQRINAFHMDEYIGLAHDAPQGFANFLKAALFDHVPFKSVNLLDSMAEPAAEAARYSCLLREHPADIVCMGIGENGHIAFNDPHVADFADPVLVKPVDLDEICRMQQVHDGCFANIEAVPHMAMTLTIPALTAAKYQFCVVPAASKAEAVGRMVRGEVTPACPASILRTLEHAALYCDAQSGRNIIDWEAADA